MRKRKFIFSTFQLFLFSLFNFFTFKNSYSKTSKTNILFHKNFLKYIISDDHPEKPERIKYLLNEILKTNLKDDLINVNLSNLNHDPYFWIKKIHTSNHIFSLKKKNIQGEVASKTATMICLHGIDRIISGIVKNIFCLVRPPGHHALNTGRIEGFCFYNHIAVAAKYIQVKYKLKKILIVDWDYHHGNSTEHFFYDDPSILFFSTHDQFAYPGTGSPEKKGRGNGLGYNVNIHLPCGTNDEKILKIYRTKLFEKAIKFKPDFVLISAGFDSRKEDPLGCFDLSDEAFEGLTKVVVNIANQFCDGRILSVLEGGYNIVGNSSAAIKHINTLKNFF